MGTLLKNETTPPWLLDAASKQMEQLERSIEADIKQAQKLKFAIAKAKADRISINQLLEDAEGQLDNLESGILTKTENMTDLRYAQGPAWDDLKSKGGS